MGDKEEEDDDTAAASAEDDDDDEIISLSISVKVALGRGRVITCCYYNDHYGDNDIDISWVRQ